ncbi:hypothetical protein COCNU_08G004810 [Cocos nucifera]|uniref:Uncharacterized protein n=1 Tax=Cocos nucifera TaxID=13894 RepID=A0A8K0II83_COCNU|nr:hypothetical protein COCNU_08G004810 [Cocos nucifera]
MESRNKKPRDNSDGEVAKRSRIPYDLIHFNILPRLSFKTLCRFENVCKAGHDPFFALEQSRGPSPTSSSGFVYLGRQGLEFLSSPNTPVGVPDPSLSFLGSHLIRLVASTNGLAPLLLRPRSPLQLPLRPQPGYPGERLLSRWLIQPLAFEGGDKLYLWVRAAGNGKNEKERVLCHDLSTGEVTLISNNVSFAPGEHQIFTYRNSMARFPNWSN